MQFFKSRLIEYCGKNYSLTEVLKENASLGSFLERINILAPVVQRVDSAIRWINHYPLDTAINFDSTYPLDSDLSSG